MNGPTALSPWLPTAPCTPGRCTTHPDPDPAAPDPTAPEPGTPTPALRAPTPGVRPARAVARLLAGLGVFLVGLLLAPVAGLLPAAARHALVRRWVRAVVRAFGVRVRYEAAPGRPATEPGLVVANHVSWLDVPLLAAVLPGRMVAKAEVRRWPVLGPVAALGGTLFIARDRLRSLPGTVAAMAGVLASGGRVVVFPEGSTWCGRTGGRFRPAPFQAALDSGRDVLPVRIDYRPTDTAAYVADDPLAASLWRVVSARRLTATVRVLDPLPAHAHTDRRSLAAAAERAVGTGQAAGTGGAVGAGGAVGTGRATTVPAQRAVASDSANRPFSSVHQCSSPRPASASSSRTPS
ncbi:lysophospholipid acyltransferase family protein [Streptomyces sp. NPDC003327]